MFITIETLFLKQYNINLLDFLQKSVIITLKKRKRFMLKIINSLLFMFLLSACSSQESNETNKTIKTNNTTKTITEEKSVVQTDKVSTTEESNQAEIVKEAIVKEAIEKTSTTKDTATDKALFTLKTLAGKTIHINEATGGLVFEEFKEKIVFLLFFGHKCPPCLAEIPVLKALMEKGHKDLEIVALEVQGLAKNQLENFKQKKGINYHLVTGEGNYEFISYIGEKANWNGGIPFLIGFNKQGAVKAVHIGGIGASEFDNIYDALSQVEKK